MKTFKIRTAKICVLIILNDHLTNCAKAHSLLELWVFSPFMGQHVIDQKSTSSQARSHARPPSEPCEWVLTLHDPFHCRAAKSNQTDQGDFSNSARP